MRFHSGKIKWQIPGFPKVLWPRYGLLRGVDWLIFAIQFIESENATIIVKKVCSESMKRRGKKSEEKCLILLKKQGIILLL